VSADEAYKRLFAIWRAGGQPRAEQQVEGYLRKYPGDDRLLFFQAACLRGRGAIAQADALFERIQKAGPAAVYGRGAAVVLELDAAENIEASLAVLTDLCRGNPGEPMLEWLLAVECRDYHKNADGLRACARLLAAAGPGSARVQELYADLLTDSGKSREALQHRILAARLEPAKWSFLELADALEANHIKISAELARWHASERTPTPMSMPAELAFPLAERKRLYREYDRVLNRIGEQKHGAPATLPDEPLFQAFLRREHLDYDQSMELQGEGYENHWPTD
jgi:tetratricopeptide (TPR) repeat protein